MKHYADLDFDNVGRPINVPTPTAAGHGVPKEYVDPPVDLTSTLVGDDVQEVWKRLAWPTTSQVPVIAADGTITSITYYQGSTQTTPNRMAVQAMTYDSNFFPATETLTFYSLTDGTTVLKTITRTYTFVAALPTNAEQVTA